MQLKSQQQSLNAFTDFDSYPDSAQIRLPVVKALLGVSSATIWRMVKLGKLKTYKFTSRTTTFNVGEIRQLLNQQGDARGN